MPFEWSNEVVLATAAIVSAGVVLYRWVLKPAGKLVYNCLIRPVKDKVVTPLMSYSAMEIAMQEMQRSLGLVLEELRPNGGTSLRDAVNRIESSLTLSEQRQRAFMADSDIALFECDGNGDCVFVNRTLCRMTGMNPDQLLGKGWRNIIHEDDREVVEGVWYNSAKDGIEVHQNVKIRGRQGSPLSMILRSYKMVGPLKEPIGFIGTLVPA